MPNGVPHCNAVREVNVKLKVQFSWRSAHDLADHEHSRELHLTFAIQLSPILLSNLRANLSGKAVASRPRRPGSVTVCATTNCQEEIERNPKDNNAVATLAGLQN